MVVVPAGGFRMGCVSGRYCEDDEWPVHEVAVASFAMSKYEVTRGEFAAFAAATSHAPGECTSFFVTGSWRDQSWQSDEHPVVCVNWDDAQAYVRWLRDVTGHHYRLPSESEWEYATRAGTTTPWLWGDRAQDRCDYSNAAGDDCDDGWRGTAPVGTYAPNGFGLYDMAGNVSEWVEDCRHPNYEGAPRDGSAWTRGGDCSRRRLRGGDWFLSYTMNHRSASRNSAPSVATMGDTGFRVARPFD
jgi:formylglycine-generating enzyme required for sulfatase activity